MHVSRKQMIGGAAAIVCLGVLVAGTSWVAAPPKVSVAAESTPTPTPTPSETPTPTPSPSGTPEAVATESAEAAPVQQAQPAQEAGIAALVAQSSAARRTSQVLVVVGSGVSAHVVLVSEQSDGTWASTVEAWGHVGSGGVGSASEYSSATPAGVWPLTAAFGSAGNPGAALPYRAITSASCYISDVNDPQYNTWQERSSCPAPNEHMADYPTQYAYGLVMGYNQSGTPGAGSAFFVHVDNGAATAGCVSVPAWMMVSLLQSIRPGALIANVTSESALANI